MKTLEKNTELSLQELLDRLGRNGQGHPSCMLSCMLINEVGIICAEGQDEEGAGEKYLVSLLGNSDPNQRAIAFSFLSYRQDMAERNAIALTEFRARAENAALMPLIDEALNEKQEEE